jgi:chitin synthase
LQELEQEKKEAEEAKKKARQKSLLGFLNGTGGGKDSDEGSVEFSLAGLFKIMLCTHPKSVDEKHQLLRIAESLDSLSRRLETIERFVHLRLSRMCELMFRGSGLKACCILVDGKIYGLHLQG